MRKRVKNIFISLGVFLTLGLSSNPVLAADTPIKFTLKNYGFTDLGPLLQVLITLILSFAGLLFMAYLFIGGLAWITAGGDPKAVAAARSRITNALIGFVLVVATYAIILIIEKVFGINIVSGITIK